MKHAVASAATRAALIEQFCKLYQHLPIEKVTVKDISAHAGVSRVTFYNYFSDPYQLLDELEDELIAAILSNARTAMERGFDLESFTSIFIKVFEENNERVKLLFLGSHADAFANKAKNAFIDMMKPLFIDYETDPLVRYAVEYHVAGMVALFQRWLGQNDVDTEEMAFIVRNLVTKGALTSILASRGQ